MGEKCNVLCSHDLVLVLVMTAGHVSLVHSLLAVSVSEGKAIKRTRMCGRSVQKMTMVECKMVVPCW